MTLMLTHARFAAVQDSGDGKLSSDAWNECHNATGTPNYVLGFDANGVGTDVNPATLLTSITLTGDVTGTGTGSVATTIASNAVTTGKILDGAVTLAKQANMATASVVYRKTAGSGAPEVQTLATLKTDLGLTGTNSGDQTITLTGDVTGTGTGSFAATIANGAVTTGKMANIAANTVLGNGTGSTAAVTALTTIPTATMPAHTGDVTSSAGSVALTIAADAVTYAKMQNVSATDKLLGRATAGSGDVEEITCTAAGRALIDDADATAQRVTLGVDAGWTIVTLGSDFTTSSTTPVDVTSFSFTPAANKTYEVQGRLLLRTSNAAAGPQPGLSIPTGMTDAAIMIQAPNGATGSIFANVGTTTTTGRAQSTSVGNTTESWPGIFTGIMITGSSPSGTFKVQLASETGGADSATMKAGSIFKYRAIA